MMREKSLTDRMIAVTEGALCSDVLDALSLLVGSLILTCDVRSRAVIWEHFIRKTSQMIAKGEELGIDKDLPH